MINSLKIHSSYCGTKKMILCKRNHLFCLNSCLVENRFNKREGLFIDYLITHSKWKKIGSTLCTLRNRYEFLFGRAMLVPTNRAKRYRGPRKVLRSKLFGERRNKCSKLKRFAREPFSLAKFVWTSGCPAHHSSLFSIHYSLRESFFHANRPLMLLKLNNYVNMSH